MKFEFLSFVLFELFSVFIDLGKKDLTELVILHPDSSGPKLFRFFLEKSPILIIFFQATKAIKVSHGYSSRLF